MPLATLVDRDTGLLLGLVAVFAWVPLTSAIDAWHARRPSLGIDFVAVLVDWALLIALAMLVPEVASMVALAQLPLVAWWASVDVGRLGTPAATLSMAPVTIALLNFAAPTAIVVGAPFVFAIVVAGLFWLQRESFLQQRSTTAHLHRLHRRSSAILTGIGEAVVLTDTNGYVREVNRAGQSTLALTEDAAGHSCTEMLGLRDGIRTLDCSEGCALLSLPGADTGDAQVMRKLPTGVEQPLLAGAQVVGTGQQAEVVHSFRDITRLRQAEEAKSLFLATASHELKTPITVIRGFTEILIADHANGVEMEQAALQAIQRRTEELAQIVDRMLLSSRIEHGRIDLIPVPIEVAPVLAERIGALDSVLDNPITLEAEEDLPAVYGDVTALATIVDHLLENAAKYSPGSTPIRVAARHDGDDVLISVADQGIGMTAEQVEHCFDQFWQAEATDVRRFGGTGIGLYVVRSLARAMHGEITVDSTPGQGSTFTLRLSCRDPAELRQPVVGTPAADAPDSIIQEFMRQIGVGPELAPIAGADSEAQGEAG